MSFLPPSKCIRLDKPYLNEEDYHKQKLYVKRKEVPLLDSIDPALLVKSPNTRVGGLDPPYTDPSRDVEAWDLHFATDDTGETGETGDIYSDTGSDDVSIDLAALNHDTLYTAASTCSSTYSSISTIFSPLPPDDPKIFFYDEETIPERLWLAIFIQNTEGVEELVEEGATAMTNTGFGGYAIDMAVRLEDADIVRVFLPNREALGKYGLRAVLIAVNTNTTEMMKVLLDIGMREYLAADETAKIIVFGHVCKHGTPEMLETLSERGPWFSWKAYWYWCLRLSDQTKKGANGNKVWELKEAYMEREGNKKPLMYRNDVLDTWDEAQELPPIHQVMRLHCNANPDHNIGDLYHCELLDPLKYINSTRHASVESIRRRTGPWDIF
ncbi:hypothetical protein BDW72DRAFT_196209 [Aspergillus terricola var. indicus]